MNVTLHFTKSLIYVVEKKVQRGYHLFMSLFEQNVNIRIYLGNIKRINAWREVEGMDNDVTIFVTLVTSPTTQTYFPTK